MIFRLRSLAAPLVLVLVPSLATACTAVESEKVAAIDAPADAPRDVGYYADANVPLETRLQEIDALGRRAHHEESAALALLAIAEAPIYLNWAAARALSGIRSASVLRGLTELVRSDDPSIAVYAARALAASSGPGAAPVLAPLLKRNADGYDTRSEVASLLASTHAREAVAPLVVDLDALTSRLDDLEYGSALVLALASLGGEAAREAVSRYASALRTLPAHESADAAAQEYVAAKTAEAVDALASF